VLKTGEGGLDRALTVLDRTLYKETIKIGLLYVNEGQTRENQILGNQSGSPRYHKVNSSLVFCTHYLVFAKSWNYCSS
jgi:hypothetical protein